MLSKSKSKISFFFETPVILRNRNTLKMFIESIFKKEGRKLFSLNYIFCSDSGLLEINRQFLQHDYYTDIISFDLSNKYEPLEGEIYISIERVKENSLNVGEPYTQELHRVIFHGALHLCGYKDKTPKERKEMRKMEEVYLKKYQESFT